MISVDSVGSGDGRRRGRGDECRFVIVVVDLRVGEDGVDLVERGEVGYGG